jgi:hypothetical protein
MPNKYAIQNGFFDRDTTWSLSPTVNTPTTVPTVGDVAVANTRTVTITSNVRCDAITMSSSYGSLSGGIFLVRTINNDVNIHADIVGADIYSTTHHCLSGDGSRTLSITGAISPCFQNYGTNTGRSACVRLFNTGVVNLSTRFVTTVGGYQTTKCEVWTASALNIYNQTLFNADVASIYYNGRGVVNVYGELSTNSNGSGYSLYVGNASAINVYSDINALIGNTGGSIQYPFYYNGGIPCTINTYGKLIGRKKGGSPYAVCIVTAGNCCTLNVYGDMYQGTSGSGQTSSPVMALGGTVGVTIYGKMFMYDTYICPLIHYYAGGSLTVFQDLSANPYTGMIRSDSISSLINIHGNIINHEKGTQAIYARSFNWNRIPYDSYIKYGTGEENPPIMYHTQTDSLSAFRMPPVSSVRSGVIYGGGALTGTCVIPNINDIAYGVPVDDGKRGTAVIGDISDLFNLEVNSLSATNSVGQRMANAMTMDFFNKTMNSY